MPEPVRSTTWRRRRWMLAAVAMVATVLVGAVYVLAFETGVGSRLDEAGTGARDLIAIEDYRRPGLLFLSTIGVLTVAVVGVAAMAVAAIRRRPRLALAAGAIILGSNLTTQTLKLVFLPALWDALGRPFADAPAFPSGHSTVAMSFAVAIVLVASRPRRWVAAIIGLAYATAIGAATAIAGWHRPSEVLAAYLVVAVWTAAVVALLPAAPDGPTSRPAAASGDRGVRRLGLLATALGVGALGAAAASVAADGADATDAAALVAGLGAIGALGGAVVTGLLVALGPVVLDPRPAPRSDQAGVTT